MRLSLSPLRAAPLIPIPFPAPLLVPIATLAGHRRKRTLQATVGAVRCVRLLGHAPHCTGKLIGGGVTKKPAAALHVAAACSFVNSSMTIPLFSIKCHAQADQKLQAPHSAAHGRKVYGVAVLRGKLRVDGDGAWGE